MQEWEWNFQMGKLVICALRLLIMCECVNWRYVTLVDFAERREQRVSLISGVFLKKENVFRASVNTESEAKILQSIKQSWSLTDLCADYKLSPALIQQDLVQRFAANPDPVRPFLPLQPTLPPVTQDHMGCELIHFNFRPLMSRCCHACLAPPPHASLPLLIRQPLEPCDLELQRNWEELLTNLSTTSRERELHLPTFLGHPDWCSHIGTSHLSLTSCLISLTDVRSSIFHLPGVLTLTSP